MCYPAYSALLCVSNTEKLEWLSVALDSMINQTVKPAEIVLVEDCSLTDNQNALINQYKEKYPNLFKTLSVPCQTGLGNALKQGFSACTNGFVACMDADGYSVPTRIEEEFNAMFENKVDMVGTNINEFVESTDNVVTHRMFPETPERIYKYAKKRTPMSHASVLLKKRMVLVCGNYENCYMAEDFALFINLLNMCAKGYNVQKPLVYKRLTEEFYRQHSGWDYFNAMIKFNQKFYENGWFTYRDYVIRSVKNGVESLMLPIVRRRVAIKKKCMQKKNHNSLLNRKVLGVASVGGHWIELLRILKPLDKTFDVVYVSTHSKCACMVNGSKFHCVVDFNRWNFWKMSVALFQTILIIVKERPDVIISTGAAPGLLGILVGKFLFRDTVWIDSVANVEQLSCCGKIAKNVARHTYTQWPDLANHKVKFAGSIFGDKL